MIRILLLVLLLTGQAAHAHKSSDSYLQLHAQGDSLRGRWDIALRDLDYALGLDRNGDGRLTWGEVRAAAETIKSYALAHLALAANDTACPLQAGDLLIDEHSDGRYAVLPLSARCSKPVQSLNLNYSLFFDLDRQHRGLLTLQSGDAQQTAIFSPEGRRQHWNEIGGEPAADAWTRLQDFAREGVWHIWIGYDHLLFLLSLLLPAALIRESKGWQPKTGFKTTLGEVVAVVSAFTLAHSLTLSLAVLQIVSLPSRWVEAAIAASVLLAALNNIVPCVTRRKYWVAFGFGLIHGLGIASVLLDMQLSTQNVAWALFSFNLGVELGQLAVVAAVLPLIGYFSRYRYYPAVAMHAGSATIAGLALIWLAERSLDINLISG